MAIEIALQNRIGWGIVRAWSKREGFEQAFEEFRERVTQHQPRRGAP